jgi:hypothetical protein
MCSSDISNAADSFIGYHEALDSVKADCKEAIKITTFPSLDRPLIMSDILVKRKGLTEEESLLAERVSRFLTDAYTLNDIMLGKDLTT